MTTAFDAAAVRADFPVLGGQIYGKDLVYLDSAASAQKPSQVLDAQRAFDATTYSNIHRGVHRLSQDATRAYEDARKKIAGFLGAPSEDEIVLTSGTTEAINLVAQSWGRSTLGPDDEVVITWMEHHSNIVPWQLVAEQTGCTLRVVPINDKGELDLDEARRLIGPRTRMVAFAHVSNALGTVNPVSELVAMAKTHGALTLLDGAQAVPHVKVDVAALGCDFYAFSGHKLFGPSGTGALWGRRALLDSMPPWKGGGDMILSVSFDGTRYNSVPHKFEAGTPNITGVVGLGAAIDYLGTLDLDAAFAHEHALVHHATESLVALGKIRVIGTADQKASVVSFVTEGIHPHDMGTILDQEGVAVRAGHHCAQPVMEAFGIPATTRASFAFYNTHDDVDRLVAAVRTALEIFG
jgi:cysteine desulfurase / selenocysteine lyase